eukprot:gene4306-5391_t
MSESIIRRLFLNRSPLVQNFSKNYHSETLDEIENAVNANKVVVVGMSLNPHVSQIRKELTNRNIPFTYLEYGGYFSQWDKRLAIKMWTGWPTFPQVFVNGQLIGGADDAIKELNEGSVFKN